MKVYIAGPMTGLPNDNFPAFHKAAAAWRAAGWEVLNPAESFEGARGLPYKHYVEHDINLLKRVDAIALLPGWDAATSRGSVWEWGIARQFLRISVFNAETPCSTDPTTWPLGVFE